MYTYLYIHIDMYIYDFSLSLSLYIYIYIYAHVPTNLPTRPIWPSVGSICAHMSSYGRMWTHMAEMVHAAC